MDDITRRFEMAKNEFNEAANGQISIWNQYWDVIDRYKERHRKYHTVKHVTDTFEIAEAIFVHDFSWKYDLVCRCITALVWHDAVYTPGSSTNEEDSAVLAKAAGHVDVDILKAIRKTKTHRDPDSILEMIVLDADLLAGLNPCKESYETNSKLVRGEYSFFGDEEFYAGRKKVLRSFLDRPNIFYTRYAAQFENAVRDNMENELAEIIAKGF